MPIRVRAKTVQHSNGIRDGTDRWDINCGTWDRIHGTWMGSVAWEVQKMMRESIFTQLTPADLHLPSKFDRFRHTQSDALEWLYESESPICAACLPTGSGKTALAVALSRLLACKTVYLVATKALEQQVLRDFESMGMVNVHGRANYRCPNYGNCANGYDEDCSLSGTTGCNYTIAVDHARNAQIVVTNYAYWLHARRSSGNALELDGCPVELLICDEAHAIESQLSGYASVKIYLSEHKLPEPNRPYSKSGQMSDEEPETKSWKSFAKNVVSLLVDSTDDDDKDLVDRCRRILRMSGNWVWQFDDKGHVTFEPVHLLAFTKSLFSGVPRVLLMSASLDKFTCRLLLPSDMAFDYRAWQSSFPPANAPVYHIPTVKLSWKSTDEDYQAIVRAMDAIIDRRLDRKGIIHTISYARTKRALQYSNHAGRFIWNDNVASLQNRLGQFRASPPGSLLATPSAEEGFDFPADECEYQIILKFPFPNETQRVIRERCNQIPGYRLHYATQKIVQMRGRPIRSPTDRAETFILDNAVAQMTGHEGKSYCPPGFRMFTVAKVPPAPPRMNK